MKNENENETGRRDGSEFVIPTGIEFEDMKGTKVDEDMIRLYKSSPGIFTLQFRSRTGIGFLGAGVKRNMIATAYLSFDEAESLAAEIFVAVKKARTQGES